MTDRQRPPIGSMLNEALIFPAALKAEFTGRIPTFFLDEGLRTKGQQLDHKLRIWGLRVGIGVALLAVSIAGLEGVSEAIGSNDLTGNPVANALIFPFIAGEAYTAAGVIGAGANRIKKGIYNRRVRQG